MTQYIEAPNECNIKPIYGRSIFLAGGITACVDWQKVAKDALMETDKYEFILNPRRDDFDVTDTSVSAEQIEWEAKYIFHCNDILFWFSNETVQPITLFELGMNVTHNTRSGKVFVGCDPDYSRRFDVVTQLKLHAPYIRVWDNLDDMMEHIVKT